MLYEGAHALGEPPIVLDGRRSWRFNETLLPFWDCSGMGMGPFCRLGSCFGRQPLLVSNIYSYVGDILYRVLGSSHDAISRRKRCDLIGNVRVHLHPHPSKREKMPCFVRVRVGVRSIVVNISSSTHQLIRYQVMDLNQLDFSLARHANFVVNIYHSFDDVRSSIVLVFSA